MARILAQNYVGKGKLGWELAPLRTREASLRCALDIRLVAEMSESILLSESLRVTCFLVPFGPHLEG